jgi:hypothetical protein
VLRSPTPEPAPDDQVHRISAAPHRHSDDLSMRINRYLVSMAIRTVCVVLVVVVHGPLRWLFAVGAIGLPYVAVILANASSRPRESGPEGPTARVRGSLDTGPAGGPETVTVTYTTEQITAAPSTPEPTVASSPTTVAGTVVETGAEAPVDQPVDRPADGVRGGTIPRSSTV